MYIFVRWASYYGTSRIWIIVLVSFSAKRWSIMRDTIMYLTAYFVGFYGWERTECGLRLLLTRVVWGRMHSCYFNNWRHLVTPMFMLTSTINLVISLGTLQLDQDNHRANTNAGYVWTAIIMLTTKDAIGSGGSVSVHLQGFGYLLQWHCHSR